MPFTVLYVWQSDQEPAVCQQFIGAVLREAISVLKLEITSAEMELAHAPEIPQGDEIEMIQGSAGKAGAPSIADTIVERIEQCDVFVADLTFVTKYSNSAGRTKNTPNSNVLLETGIAASTGNKWDRMIFVMNTHFGEPEELPFDLRHRECKVFYELGSANDPGLMDTRSGLKSKLIDAIRPIYLDHVKKRTIKDIEEITRVIPSEAIPANGKWLGLQLAAANIQLATQIVGRRAELDIQIAKTGKPTNGRYIDMHQLLACLPRDDKRHFNVLLYSYYAVTDSRKPQVAVGQVARVVGRVTRADIDRNTDTQADQLNIDNHSL